MKKCGICFWLSRKSEHYLVYTSSPKKIILPRAQKNSCPMIVFWDGECIFSLMRNLIVVHQIDALDLTVSMNINTFFYNKPSHNYWTNVGPIYCWNEIGRNQKAYFPSIINNQPIKREKNQNINQKCSHSSLKYGLFQILLAARYQASFSPRLAKANENSKKYCLKRAQFWICNLWDEVLASTLTEHFCDPWRSPKLANREVLGPWNEFFSFIWQANKFSLRVCLKIPKDHWRPGYLGFWQKSFFEFLASQRKISLNQLSDYQFKAHILNFNLTDSNLCQ